MALNWQHIKGVYGSDNALVYTYLEFLADENSTPKLYTGNTNTSTPNKEAGIRDWGNILTTGGMAQTITKSIRFNTPTGCRFYDNSKITFGTSTNNTYIKYDLTTLALLINSETDMVLDAKNIIFGKPADDKFITFKNNITLESKKTLVCGNSTKISEDYIQAPYFNATSDKRAKTNIQPFNGSALDIINKLQTYTYNYTNSQIKSYGLMAQDLLDVDLNGFSFVDNKTATGTNNDYMTIHESKLVYLLIEAVKEQQTQINELKQKLEELTNGK